MSVVSSVEAAMESERTFSVFLYMSMSLREAKSCGLEAIASETWFIRDRDSPDPAVVKN